MEQCRENEAAIVTGASSGIGAAISARLCEMGYEVFGIGRSFGSSFAEQFPDAADNPLFHAVVCDLLDTEKMLKLVRGIAAEAGVTLLVNNAGVAGQALFQDVTDEMWHRYFSTNVDGAYHAIQAVLPAMLHAHEGCILNISSIWGQRGASCEVTYSCTKAALIGLTRSLASELAPTGIRVNCVAPGVIETDMLSALPP